MKKVSCLLLCLLVAGTTFAVSLQENLAGGVANLEHRWRFDGNLNDEFGAHAAMKSVGAGRSYSFGSDYIDLNNQWGDNWNSQMTFVDLPDNIIKNLANTNGYTIEMWVNTDDAHWNSGYFAFAPERTYDGATGDGTQRLAWTSYENDYFKASWRQSAGGWYHQIAGGENLKPPMAGFQLLTMVVLEDVGGQDAIAAYVNGAYKGFWSGVPWEGAGLDNDAWWNGIGGYLGTAPDNDHALDGKIYDFRIWSRQLSGEEIVASYNLGSEVLTTIPEPATLGLLGLGAMSLLRRRK